MNKIDGNDQSSAGSLRDGAPAETADPRPASREHIWRRLFYGAAGVLVLGSAAAAVMYYQGVIGLSASSGGSG
ncbi:hypothetical protein GHK46_25795, partial [Sinorhizobium medicae]|nr:hypothetical protein [Sinorhizobium medicae]